MWILIVEDEPLVGRVLARTLSRHAGVETRIAEGLPGVHALLQASDEPPVAALLDYDLGASAPTGVDVMLALRDEGLDIPVAFCTGGHAHHVERKLSELGEDRPCFSKPVDVGHLAQWVLSTLDPAPPP